MGKRMFPTRHAEAAAILVAAAIMLCGTAAAQRTEDTRTLVVVGAAAVQGSNITAARDAAITNGLMQAVCLATVEIASPEGFAENFKKLSELLLDRPDEYIQDFKVLSEATFAKNHRVLVQATVAGTKIREALAGAGLLREKAATGLCPGGPHGRGHRQPRQFREVPQVARRYRGHRGHPGPGDATQ